MSTQPANYDLLVPQRASLEETFRFPYDGTGSDIFASIYDNERRRRKFLDLNVLWLNRLEIIDSSTVRSTVKISASWEDTREITKDGYWDLLWVWPDGSRDYLVEGRAVLNLNVSEEP
jgi:hypothetical protein